MESVLILSMVLSLLSGLILVKGQDRVDLFGDDVTLPCLSPSSSAREQFTWSDQTNAVINIYVINELGDKNKTFDGRNNDKYDNFDIENNYPNDVNLLIKSLEVKDAGMYRCLLNDQASPPPVTISVEAMPISVLISCARSSPTDNCSSPSSPTSDSFSCNCTAFGAYPETLQFDWSGGATVGHQSDSDNNERTGTFDIYTDAEIVPTENPGSVTCTLNGYNQTWEGVRNATYTFNPPMCELKTTCIKTGNAVSLTCTCNDASPAEGLVYIFYRDGELLSSGDTNVVEADIEVDQEYIFSCRGCNGLNYGSESNDTQTVMCQRSTTALPTTTITTVPLSTKGPTSTKESGTLGTGAIVGISLGALAVVIVIVVIAVIMCKKGKCGSKSDRSNIDNGIVNDGMEIPPPIYADMKKKSDKTDDNGAGPGVDPEIPAYGVIDKNRTKDPTPAPLSSMRDSTNSSNPKQDMKMQYADIDHGNKPPSDEVRKPKKEPTEYATVQPVIV